MYRTGKRGKNSNLATQARLPIRYRCKVGGEWQPLDKFSKSQQQKHIKPGLDPAQSGMCCIEHSAKGKGEMRCEGKCGLMKPLDAFSKTRRRQQDYTCEQCIGWDEIQEYGVTPTPHENGLVSPEEQEGYVATNQPGGPGWAFWGTDMQPQAPITGMQSLTVQDDDDTVAPVSDTCSVAETEVSSSTLPPHLGGPSNGTSMPYGSTTSGWDTRSTSTGAVSLGDSGYIPPHLRGPSSGPRSVSTATTTRENRVETENSRQVAFNAWDPKGKQHAAVKAPTIASTYTGGSVTDEGSADLDENKREKRGNWATAPRLSNAELRRLKGPYN